ncbi:MAG TPA: hypothetical protein VFX61_19345 [Micromonosporaceae bacterium]|nr:hypothetical protein [Micromonosporaceae bacterium]
MDDLTGMLRAAVEEPPPTRIDLDRLISGERRRRRHLTLAGLGTGVAAAVAAILVVPALLAAPGPRGDNLSFGAPSSPAAETPSPPPTLCAPWSLDPTGPQPPVQSHGTQRTRPAESPEAAVLRLTAELRRALRDDLPPLVEAAGLAQPNCPHPQFQFDPKRGEYVTVLRVMRHDVTAYLQIRLLPTPSDDDLGCHAVDEKDACTFHYRPDESCQAAEECTFTIPPGNGTTASVYEESSKDGHPRVSVLVRRPDGTSALLTLSTEPGALVSGGPTEAAGKELPMDDGALFVLGTYPGLTLYH